MRILESGQFILGSDVELFEREVAEYCDVKYAISETLQDEILSLPMYPELTSEQIEIYN